MTVTAREISELLGRARYYLYANDDREQALAITRDAHDKLQHLNASDEERGDLYARFASRYFELDDDEQCESFAIKAIEVEQALAEPDLLDLANRHLFYAKFLGELGRIGESAHHARKGIAFYEKVSDPADRELDYIRRSFEPILRAGTGE